MEHFEIKTERTSHVYTLGNPEAKNKCLVTHGYAMTADQILSKFRDLDLEKYQFVAPEALSRFYIKHAGEEHAVASWMTSRHRIREIEDYCNYLHKLIEYMKPVERLILFGFSQGGTTMWRFINAMKPDFSVFINWAGDIPTDTDYDLSFLRDKTLKYIFGSEDKYIDSKRMNGLKKRVVDLKLDISFREFNGQHRIDRKILSSVFSEL